MTWHLNPFAIVFLLSTLLTSGVLVYTLRHQQVKGASYFAFLVVSVTLWAFFQALEYIVFEPESKILFAKLQYLGISTIGVAWYLFSLGYNRKENWLGKNYLFLLVIPALSFVTALTNETHGWLWPQITPITTASGSNLIYAHGPAFWAIFIYNYILLALGTLVIIRTAITSKEIYRWQMIGLVASAIIPWLGNLIYVAGLSPVPGLDLTPLGFALSALITAWSIFFLRLFDLVPVARDQLVEKLIDGVLVLDAHHRIADLNPKARELLGVKNERAVGRELVEFLHPWPDLVKRFENVNQGEAEVYLGEGEVSDIDVRISPLLDDRHQLVGRIIIIRDISEQKKQERLRENLTQAIVYDLRNPLTSVALALEQLRRQVTTILPRGQIETLDVSRQSVQQMLELVESILDVYRLESGEMPLSRKKTSLYSLVAEAIKMTAIQANQKRILVQLDVPNGLPDVYIDPVLMRRVIQNLLDNALKHSQAGWVIRIQSSLERRDDTVILSFTNLGDDLEEAVKESLFDKSQSTKSGGLGLAFCRLVIEAHGGRIWVDEEHQSGTKISFAIPARA
jgi:PAS domain S-box-containing protein